MPAEQPDPERPKGCAYAVANALSIPLALVFLPYYWIRKKIRSSRFPRWYSAFLYARMRKKYLLRIKSLPRDQRKRELRECLIERRKVREEHRRTWPTKKDG